MLLSVSVSVILSILARAEVGAAAPGSLLTTISQIRNLSEEEAGKALPVFITAVITRVTPFELFVQEGTEAVYVWQRFGHPELRVGQVVEVEGVTHPGHLIPLIQEKAIRIVGERHLPHPAVVTYGELLSSRSDCLYVAVKGVIRRVDIEADGVLKVGLWMEGSLLNVVCRITNPAELVSLIGAEVELFGVVSGSKTHSRKIVEPAVWMDYNRASFHINKHGPPSRFALPLKRIQNNESLMEVASIGELINLRGIATFASDRHGLLVDCDGTSVLVEGADLLPVRRGDDVIVSGFVTHGQVRVYLADAAAKVIGRSRAADPEPVLIKNLVTENFDNRVVRTTGTLQAVYTGGGDGVMMLLEDQGSTITVDVDSILPNAFFPPPVGSLISLEGACRVDALSKPTAAQIVSPDRARILVANPALISVLRSPSWWTPPRLILVALTLGVFGLLALGWIWTLGRRVRRQTETILKHAERSAILEERNRIAREFHDTLEQHLAGATFLLDAAAAVVTSAPDHAAAAIDTTRAMLRHSLNETQDAVLDLRNVALFENDLDQLLETSLREKCDLARIPLQIVREGAAPELDPLTKTHLLRIAQEAVNNAIKHASPKCIVLKNTYTAQTLSMEVCDDGKGFDTARSTRNDGEFGLIGMKERADRLGATLKISSRKGGGTTISLELALTPR